jgi:hypothetical protein
MVRGKGRDGAKATAKPGWKGGPRGSTREHGPVSGLTRSARRAGPGPAAGRARPTRTARPAGWFDTCDAAEVGRWSGLGEAEWLGPQALVTEEALDARAVADQGAKLHVSAMRAGIDGQTEGEAHQLGPWPVSAARSGAAWLGWRLGVRVGRGRCLRGCRLWRRNDQWPPRTRGGEHAAVSDQVQLRECGV